MTPEADDETSGSSYGVGHDVPYFLFPHQGRGKSTHFYHFLLTCFIPVFGFCSAPRFPVVAVQDSGPLNRWWQEIPGQQRVVVLSHAQMIQEILQRTTNLQPSFFVWLGRQIISRKAGTFLQTQRNMNKGVRTMMRSKRLAGTGIITLPNFEWRGAGEGGDMRQIVSNFMSSLGIPRTLTPSKKPKIVVIERSEIPSFYKKNEDADYGPARRSIPNLKLVATALEPLGEVRILSPENLELRQVIEEISQADVLVGQHGAGLANMVWMREKKYVIEISHTQTPGLYFPVLARLANLKLERLVCQESAHAPVAPHEVFAAVKNTLVGLLNEPNSENLFFSNPDEDKK